MSRMGEKLVRALRWFEAGLIRVHQYQTARSGRGGAAMDGYNGEAISETEWFEAEDADNHEGDEAIGNCPRCGAFVYIDMGFCGKCEGTD